MKVFQFPFRFILLGSALLSLAACSKAAEVGKQKAAQQEEKAKQQLAPVRKKTDQAQDAVQRSEQRVKNAEKQLTEPQVEPSP